MLIPGVPDCVPFLLMIQPVVNLLHHLRDRSEGVQMLTNLEILFNAGIVIHKRKAPGAHQPKKSVTCVPAYSKMTN